MKTKSDPLTHQQAIEKYFGTVIELSNKSYPWKCNYCDFLLMSITTDAWLDHVRAKHNERVMSQKMIDAVKRRVEENKRVKQTLAERKYGGSN